MAYAPYIDGLRALAVLGVVLFHAQPDLLPGGFTGVDVFFVISGYLITSVIAADLTKGTFSLAAFFVRRARRLMPAAVACFLIITVIAGFVLLPDAYWYFGRSLLSAVLMYANIFFYNTGGYFSAPSIEKPLLHTWSLAVEDQFYLTWPILMLVFARYFGARLALAITVVLLFASFSYAELKIATDPEFAFFQLPTRAFELLIGAVLARTFTDRPLPQWGAEFLAAVGLAAIAYSFLALSSEAHFPGRGALPACLGTAAIIAAGRLNDTLISRALSWRPAVFVGLTSYSFYLWHWPLIALACYALERGLKGPEAVAIVSLSFVAAVISWRFVERPFRARHRVDSATVEATEELGWRYADKRFVLSAIASVLVVIATAMTLKIGKGFPNRYSGDVRHVLDQLVAGNPRRSSCDNYQNIFTNDDVCNFGAKKTAGASYEVALFGDSMADHLAPLVSDFADRARLAGRQVTNGGCPLLVGMDTPVPSAAKRSECAAYSVTAAKFIAENPGLKIAVVSAFWEKWLARIELGGAPTAILSSDASASLLAPKFDAALTESLKIFTDRGIKVLLIGQIPVYDVMPLRCIVENVEAKSSTASCGKTGSEGRDELARSNAALDRVARALPSVSVYRPSDFLCDAEHCWLMHDGDFLYKNGQHLNRFGASRMGQLVPFPNVD